MWSETYIIWRDTIKKISESGFPAHENPFYFSNKRWGSEFRELFTKGVEFGTYISDQDHILQQIVCSVVE